MASGTTWQQEMTSACELSLRFLPRRFCCRDEEDALKTPYVFMSNKQALTDATVFGTLISDTDPEEKEAPLASWLSRHAACLW